MITLHRLGHHVEAFQLNPDLIMTVEATPDTVITLTNAHKIVVAEPPERVAADIRAYRVDVLAGAMDRRAQLRESGISPRRGLSGQLSASVTPLPLHGAEPAVQS